MSTSDNLKRVIASTTAPIAENRRMRRDALKYNRGAERKQMHLNYNQVAYMYQMRASQNVKKEVK